MHPSVDWREAASTIQWSIEPFVDGRYRSSECSEFFESVDPSTERTLHQAPVGSSDDVNHAVRIARSRCESGCWSERSAPERAAVLFRLADLLVAHKAELALMDSLEMGKPIRAALDDAGRFAPEMLRSWAGFIDKLTGKSSALSGGVLYVSVYQARGVVAAITPWNFPTVNAIYKIAPALSAGNCVVLKPSENSPSSALRIAELALEAGLPEGVLNIVPGLGSTVGAALAAHPDIDMLSFTGSTRTAQRIMELCARGAVRPLILECGGKSPQVVFDDADDVDTVAEAVVRSALHNQGQVCSAHSRLVVHEAIKTRLLDRIVHRARQVRPEHPLDENTEFGPLASPAQRDRVKAYIEGGVQAGAAPLLLGKIQEKGGCYIGPTIFDRVDSSMAIAREEIFGPVLCVQSFATEHEALSLANATEFGLNATIWTRDLGRGIRFGRSVRAGHVAVRSGGAEGPGSGYLLGYEPMKSSGFGAELGLEGLKSYSTLRSLSFAGS